MIIGNGQLAKAFDAFLLEGVVIFASGVANSNCVEKRQFEREKNLLIQILSKYKGKKFVYFSSCALSAEEYPKNMYYRHKYDMEEIIKSHTDNYYIFRVPQLFGSLKEHKTLINFIYFSIINDNTFKLYDQAYRYILEINDLKLLVENYLKFSEPGITINLANDYRYNVVEIVKIFEQLLEKKARYDLFEKYDGYYLDLNDLNHFIRKYKLNLNFGYHYLEEKLKLRVNEVVSKSPAN